MDRITDVINDLTLAIKEDTQAEMTETQVQMLYALADLSSAKVRYNSLVKNFNEFIDTGDEWSHSTYLGDVIVESDERNG